MSKIKYSMSVVILSLLAVMSMGCSTASKTDSEAGVKKSSTSKEYNAARDSLMERRFFNP